MSKRIIRWLTCTGAALSLTGCEIGGGSQTDWVTKNEGLDFQQSQDRRQTREQRAGTERLIELPPERLRPKKEKPAMFEGNSSGSLSGGL